MNRKVYFGESPVSGLSGEVEPKAEVLEVRGSTEASIQFSVVDVELNCNIGGNS